MNGLKAVLPPLLLLFSLPCRAEPGTLRFLGYAYDLETGAYLYTEVHEQKIENERWRGGSIVYLAPNGSEVGRKSLDFSRDPFVPLYRLDLKPGGGYMEGITEVTSQRIVMVKQGYGETQPRAASVVRPNPVVADSGFHSFLRERFPELAAGKTVSFHFAVAGSLDVFKFRAKRIKDGRFEGQPVVRLRVEPDSLLRWLVDPLEVSYEPTQRRLLEYRGVSNLHDPATGKAYNVRIVYPSTRPADAPPLPPGY